MLILQKVQVLDQEIGPARAFAEKGLDLEQRRRVRLTALRHLAGFAPPSAGMDAARVG